MVNKFAQVEESVWQKRVGEYYEYQDLVMAVQQMSQDPNDPYFANLLLREKMIQTGHSIEVLQESHVNLLSWANYIPGLYQGQFKFFIFKKNNTSFKFANKVCRDKFVNYQSSVN